MSAELERQLRDAFGRLPRPTREASARARSAALAALGPTQPKARGALVLIAFVLACAIGAGAAALAATGNLHVAIGAKQKSTPAVPARLVVPAGSNGIAVVAAGKLWLSTRGGLRVEGMRVSTAELSPRALYAVVGVGSSLMTLAPGNRRPWVQHTGGRVVAASWSPDGLKIAYVVVRRGGAELRMIEGDGAPDRLLARSVRPAKPSWRDDSLAVAYVDARGRAGVVDLGSGSGRIFDTRRCGGPARAIAYAPRAPALAIASAHGLAIVSRWNRPPRCARFDISAAPSALGWIESKQLVVAVDRQTGASLERFGADLNEIAAAFASRALEGLAVSPRGSSAAIAVRRSRNTVDVGIVPKPQLGRKAMLSNPLLRVRAAGPAVSISWR